MTHVLSETTRPQVERRLAETRLVVVLLGRRVAEALDCVCAPAPAEAVCPHVDFPRTITLDEGVRSDSENGVLGDPEPATAEQGARLVDACVDYFAGEIERARSVEDP